MKTTSLEEQNNSGYRVNSNFPSYTATSYNKTYNKKINGLKGLTPALPLNISKEGSFGLYEELRDNIKQNFKNLLLTDPGERIMDIDFGVGLKSYLFENLSNGLDAEIAEKIEEQKSKYMNYINIENLEFVVDDNDPNYYEISIYYSIPDLSITDSISVTIGE